MNEWQRERERVACSGCKYILWFFYLTAKVVSCHTVVFTSVSKYKCSICIYTSHICLCISVCMSMYVSVFADLHGRYVCLSSSPAAKEWRSVDCVCACVLLLYLFYRKSPQTLRKEKIFDSHDIFKMHLKNFLWVVKQETGGDAKKNRKKRSGKTEASKL